MIKKGLSIVLLCAIAVTAVVLWGRWNPNAANEDGRPKTPLLSGLVEGDEGLIDFGKDILKPATGHSETGTLAIDNQIIHNLRVPFNNGTMTFKTARDNKLLWNCRIAGMRKRFHLIDELGDAVVMNLDHSSGAECVISIPSGLHVFVEGGNGRVNIDKPRFHMDLHLANAKVGVSPADGQAYKYDVKVTTGKTEHFESAAGDRVFNLNIAVDNGAVSRY